MKRLLLVIMLVLCMAIPAMADSTLDTPQSQSTINTISIDSYAARRAEIANRDELTIWISYKAGGEIVGTDVVTVTNDVIEARGMNTDVLQKSEGDFAGFPAAYQDTPATALIDDLNAKVATYPQTDDLDYLEKAIKILFGI